MITSKATSKSIISSFDRMMISMISMMVSMMSMMIMSASCIEWKDPKKVFSFPFASIIRLGCKRCANKGKEKDLKIRIVLLT